MGDLGTIEYIGSPQSWSRIKESGADNLNADDDLSGPEKIHNEPQGPEPATAKSDIMGKTQKSATLNLSAAPSPKNNPKEDALKRQTGDMGTWVYYGRSIGILPIVLTFTIILILVFSTNFPKLWIQWNTGSNTIKVGQFVGIYAMASVLSLVATGAALYAFMMVIGVKSGLRLHGVLVKTTFAAPMSFFERIDSSVILNRFSQDMSLVDMMLPASSFEFILNVVSCLMSLILVCIGSYWVAIIIPVAVIGLYFVQRYYLRTSRQIRLLDLEHKSPIYKLFTETNEGLETIRCYGWQEYCNRNLLRRLNISQRPYYTLYMIQRWLNLVLDLVVCAIAVPLVAFALCIPDSSSTGSLGVALTSVLAFNTSLKFLIMMWTQAETSLGAVARTRSYEKDTPSEDQDDDLDPGTNWPTGRVEFRNVSHSYECVSFIFNNLQY
jgi:ATP-binding cassette subfamily C (CFTR/MRP) protein 1